MNELVSSTYSNSRKGGLVALASVALGLRGNLPEDRIRAILSRCYESMNDEDAHVRYFACESAFNVLKVCGVGALVEFKLLLGTVCKLLGDSEQDNRQAAPVLDRLLKEVVAEYYSSHRDFCDVVSIVESYLLLPSAYVKLVCLSWISFLRQTKESLFIERAHKFVPFLFSVLSAEVAGRKDLAVSAEAIFMELLNNSSQMSPSAVDLTTAVLVKYAQFQDSLGDGKAKIVLFSWIAKLGPVTSDPDLCADLAAAVVKSLSSGIPAVNKTHSELLNSPAFRGKVVASANRLARALEAAIADAPSESVGAGAIEWLLVVSNSIRLESMNVVFALNMSKEVMELAIKQFGVTNVVAKLVSSGRFSSTVSVLLEVARTEKLLPEVLAAILGDTSCGNADRVDFLRAVFGSKMGSEIFTSDAATKCVSEWKSSCSVAAFAVGVFTGVGLGDISLATATGEELETLVELLELREFESVRSALAKKPEIVKHLVGAAMRLDQSLPAFGLLFNRLQLVSVFRSLGS